MANDNKPLWKNAVPDAQFTIPASDFYSRCIHIANIISQNLFSFKLLTILKQGSANDSF